MLYACWAAARFASGSCAAIHVHLALRQFSKRSSQGGCSASVMASLFCTADHWKRKSSVHNSLRSVAFDCDVDVLSAQEDMFLAARLFPNGVRANALSVLNAVRDAEWLSEKCCEDPASRVLKSERANKMTVAALNKVRVTSCTTVDSLSLSLARAAAVCPRTLVSCVLSSCLHRRAESPERSSLRKALASLGNCATMHLGGSPLNLCEEWVLAELDSETSKTRPGHAQNVTGFLLQLLTRAPMEVRSPVDWGRCVLIICARLLDARVGDVDAAAFFATCIRWLAPGEKVRLGDVDCLPIFSALLRWIRHSRKQMKAGTLVFDDVLDCLEWLSSRISDASRLGLFQGLLLDADVTWAEILWFWCRGYGGDEDATLWQASLSRYIENSAGVWSADYSQSIAVCECLTIAASQCPRDIFCEGLRLQQPRQRAVWEFISHLMEENLHGTDELEWSVVFARQIPVLSSEEHAIAIALPYFFFLTEGGCKTFGEVHSDAILAKAFSVHIKALVSMLQTDAGYGEVDLPVHFGGLSLSESSVSRYSRICIARLVRFVDQCVSLVCSRKSPQLCLNMAEKLLDSGALAVVRAASLFEDEDVFRLLASLADHLSADQCETVRNCVQRALIHSLMSAENEVVLFSIFSM